MELIFRTICGVEKFLGADWWEVREMVQRWHAVAWIFWILLILWILSCNILFVNLHMPMCAWICMYTYIYECEKKSHMYLHIRLLSCDIEFVQFCDWILIFFCDFLWWHGAAMTLTTTISPLSSARAAWSTWIPCPQTYAWPGSRCKKQKSKECNVSPYGPGLRCTIYKWKSKASLSIAAVYIR